MRIHKYVKRISIFLVVCFFTQFMSAVGFDYGVEIETVDAFGDDYSFQRRMTPWFDIRFTELSDLRITAQGSAYIRLNPETKLYRPILDLDLFSIQIPKLPFCGGTVGFEFGRIMMKDTHGLIINQKVDGAAIHVSVPGIVMDFYGAYTGLQNYLTSSVMLSLDDYQEIGKKEDKYYGLGARRAVFEWSTVFPEFIGRADVHGDMVAQLDMRKSVQNLDFVKNNNFFKKKDVQEEVNTFYLSAGINGPFYKSTKWYYNFDMVGEFISRKTALKTETYMAAYLDASIQYFLLQNLQFTEQLQFGTKNKTYLSEYRPISYKNAGVFYEGGFNDLLKNSFLIKWKLADNFMLDCAYYGFIQPQRIKKFDRENFEKIYKYTELSFGGNGIVANDFNLRGELYFGFNNKKNKLERSSTWSVRFKCSVNL